jgi:hypothetical protein
VTHQAKVTGNYADVGTQDSHKAKFAWTVSGGPGSVTRDNVVLVGGAFTDTLTLPTASCYTITIAITITDDDTGTAGSTPASGFTADAYNVRFLAPIKDGERNLAKWGNVVPVKVELGKLCGAGGTDTSRRLFLTYAAGVGDEIEGSETIATSVSNADTGNEMRVSGGSYIFNFTTKPLGPGKDYTLLVRADSSTMAPVIQRAVLRANK